MPIFDIDATGYLLHESLIGKLLARKISTLDDPKVNITAYTITVGKSSKQVGDEIEYHYLDDKDVCKSEKEVFSKELSGYLAKLSGTELSIKKSMYDKYMKDNGITIYKLNFTNRSKSSDSNLITYSGKIVEITNDSVENLAKKNGFTVVIGDNSNDMNARKKELNKVLAICRKVVKSLKAKYKSDFDFGIGFSVDEDDKEDFIENDSNRIVISHGGLYPADSESEGRKKIDNDKYETREKIFNEMIKNINEELKKDSSMHGQVEEDWDHYDFYIEYMIK